MTSNLDKYREDLTKLISLGNDIYVDLALRNLEETKKIDSEEAETYKELNGRFEESYQRWYTEAYSIIKLIIPDRITEFEILYKGEARRKVVNLTNYTIQDRLLGLHSEVDFYGEKSFDDGVAILLRFKNQLDILKSAEARFESSLFDIKQIVKADILDSEIDSSRELLKKGFYRGAGIIAGVVLEKHLKDVCSNHKITIRKKRPTISDFNDLLKNNNIIDVPTWRLIQRLGDIRNLCGHSREREPREDEVLELIDGVDKIIKTIF